MDSDVRTKAFIRAYLGKANGNASEAARMAGYEGNNPGAFGAYYLKKPQVKAAIAEHQKRMQKRFEVTEEKVIAEYAKIAFSDMRDVAKWSGDYVSFLASEELTEEAARAVSEISSTPTEYGQAMRIKLHDKKSALDALSKKLGLFVERKQITAHVTSWAGLVDESESEPNEEAKEDTSESGET